MSATIEFRARGVLDDKGRLLDGGCLRVADGRVVEVSTRATGTCIDLGDVLLTPTLYNAHCHLELTGFAGRLPRDRGFGGWVRELLPLRAAATPDELEDSARSGARRLWDTGCSIVHDIDTTGAAARGLLGERIEAVVYREALDNGDGARRRACLETLGEPIPVRPGLREGLSPHAPFTCSHELLRELAALARERRLPLSMHWAETLEERRYLSDGSGPLAEILAPSPGRSGLDLIEAAGLLAPDLQLTLVHGNHPEPGDYARLAAAGVPLVHCPGTHAFFDREPFDARGILDAGVRLLLGTDSLASNTDLDMSAELRRFAELPGISPAEAWEAASGGQTLLGADRLAVWPVSDVPLALEDALLADRSPTTLALPTDVDDAGAGLSRYPVGS